MDNTEKSPKVAESSDSDTPGKEYEVETILDSRDVPTKKRGRARREYLVWVNRLFCNEIAYIHHNSTWLQQMEGIQRQTQQMGAKAELHELKADQNLRGAAKVAWRWAGLLTNFHKSQNW